MENGWEEGEGEKRRGERKEEAKKFKREGRGRRGQEKTEKGIKTRREYQ